MNWKNIVSNLGAVYIFAQGVYPGLDANMIWQSIENGTIFQHIMNLCLAYIAFMYGKDNIKIRYIVENDDENRDNNS